MRVNIKIITLHIYFIYKKNSKIIFTFFINKIKNNHFIFWSWY